MFTKAEMKKFWGRFGRRYGVVAVVWAVAATIVLCAAS